MWSVGVILYILLGGYPPFIDDNQRKLFRKIRKGEYEFHEEYWGPVSEDAKNLISNLLCVKASRRLTAREALQSNWIAKATDESLEKNDMGANLIEMRKFNGKRKFVSLFVHILCLFNLYANLICSITHELFFQQRAAVASVMAVNKLKNFLAFDTFQPGDMLLEDWS